MFCECERYISTCPECRRLNIEADRMLSLEERLKELEEVVLGLVTAIKNAEAEGKR